jgi:hypothetical protein
MAELSPAARAVHSAFHKAANGQAWTNTAIAAALRAAADQVVPDEPNYMRAAIPDAGWWDKHDLIRSELLAIAAELEAP